MKFRFRRAKRKKEDEAVYSSDVIFLFGLTVGLFMLTVTLIFLFATALWHVAVYTLSSVGLYRMSKKIGVKGCWRAFFPYFSDYQLGLLAEKTGVGRKKKKFPFAAGYVTLRLCGVALNYLCAAILVIFAVVMSLLLQTDEFPKESFMFLSTAEDVEGFYDAIYGMAVSVGILLIYAVTGMWSLFCTVAKAVVYFRVFRLFAGSHAGWLMPLAILFPPSAPVIFIALSCRPPVISAPNGVYTPPKPCV